MNANNAAAATATKNLTKASRQWAERPDDERFWSFEELMPVLAARRQHSVTQTVKVNQLRAVADGDEVLITGPSGGGASFTHYSFAQLSGLAGAPASYLAKLPAELVAENLNHGLAERKDDAQLLFGVDLENRRRMVRSAVGEAYARIWDVELAHGLARLTGKGWRLPPGRKAGSVSTRSRKATAEDVLRIAGVANGLSVKVGDTIVPSGLYSGDRDMFAFMVDDSKRISVHGAELVRGFMAWNSEVGARSIGLTTFLFDGVCGNHIIWGAQGVKTIRMNHVGKASLRWEREVISQLAAYANASTSEDRRRIEAAQRFEFGKDKAEVRKAVFEKKSLGLSLKTIDAAYKVVEQTPRYGSPRSAWGLANGITEMSQQETTADKRAELDRAAGKLLEMAF